MRWKGLICDCAALSISLLVAAGCGDAPTDADGVSPAPSATPSWAVAPEARHGLDPEYGQALYAQSCVTCHGPRGHGMPRQGGNLRESKFIAEQTDKQLVDFLRKGRPANDPANKLGVPMPPRGGNAALDDSSLANIVAFLRKLQLEARQDAETVRDDKPTSTQPVAAGL